MEQPTRYAWVDWMRLIGIYFIVLGHFFSIHHDWIYTFNVPLFFILSGFLTKKETDNRLFFKKLFFNYIIPILIICTVNFVVSLITQLLHEPVTIKTFIKATIKFIFAIFSGFHTYGLGGLGAMWFVYTLIILKILYQFIPKKFHIALFLITLAGTFVLCRYTSLVWRFSHSNAIIDSLLAMPFFLIGDALKRWKTYLHQDYGNKILLLIMAVAFIIVVLCARVNPEVRLYICTYSNSLIICLIGGCAGTIGIWAFSKLLGTIPAFCALMANGTMLILGFHGYMIAPLKELLSLAPIYDPLIALAIVLLFYPFIFLSNRYFPYILGYMRVAKKTT